LYSALPVAVAIAIVWRYDALVVDREIDALYSAGYSFAAVVMPAVIAALISGCVSLLLSCWVSPIGISKLYDLVYTFEHRLEPSSLDAQHFYALENGRITFYFERRASKDKIELVFVRDITPEKETVVTADVGQFVNTDEVGLLFLPTAIVQTQRAGERDPSIATFNQFWIDLGLRGKQMPKRNWVDAVELGPAEFIFSFRDWKNDQLKLKRWTSEAIKRFGSLFITMAYTLIVLALALSSVGVRRELSWRQPAIAVGIAANHTVLMIATDGIITSDVRFAWLISIVILAELLGGLLFLRFAMRTS
jgi:lipopolysaccharide export LptBFGC system permease protein LptF